MKFFRALLLLSLLGVPFAARGANPSFDSFRGTNSGFLVEQPYIFVNPTNTGGTNIFIDQHILITNSVVNITNSTVTINGTNVPVVNPTIGRLPYKSGTFTFDDSALYFIDTNTVGTTELDTQTLVLTNITGGGVLYGLTPGNYVTNLFQGTGALTNDGAGHLGWFDVSGSGLWRFTGGYLQPTDLTQPLYWTNSVTWGPGTTNVLFSSGKRLVWTNTSDGAVLQVQTPNNVVSIGSRSSDHHGTITSTSGELFLTETVLEQDTLPIVNDIFVNGGPTKNAWWMETGALTNYTKGFVGATTSDYSRLAIYHTGTNGAITYASQAAGTAGMPAPHNFTGSDVRYEGINPGLPPSSIGFVRMPNTPDCYATNIFVGALPSGTNTLFTVPANMKFAYRTTMCTASNANIANCWIGKITNSVLYPLGSQQSVNTNTTALGASSYVFYAGESVAVVNPGVLSRVELIGAVFTNTIPLMSYCLNNLSAGNNTLYTVPSGKHPTFINGSAAFQYINRSGSARTLLIYSVPNGQSVGAGTLVATQSVSDGTASGQTLNNLALFPGDSIVLNVDAGTAGQEATITLYETP